MKKLSLFLFIILINCSPSGKNTEESKAGQAVDTAVASKPMEETEEEEAERIAKEKFEEDEKAFLELNSYDGQYILNTESEGAEGTLELKYNGERAFHFKLMLKALDICDGMIEDEFFMDRTQHGMYHTDGCSLHFNFMGSYADGTIVEIEQDGQCDRMKGDCIFTGKYLK